MLKYLKIRTKLIILVLLGIIPFILLQANSIKNGFDERIELEYLALQEAGEAISTSFANYVRDLWIQESVIGMHIVANPDLTPKEIQDYLTEVQKYQETLLSLNWVHPDGNVMASSRPPMVGESIAERNFYQKILMGEDRVLSELVTSKIDNRPIILIASAMRKEGRLIGTITAAIDLDKLSLRLPPSNIRYNTIFGLIDSYGMIVYKSDDNSIPMEKRKLSRESAIWPALRGEVIRVNNRRSAFGNYSKLGVNLPIKQIGWACSMVVPYESVMKQAYENLWKDIAVVMIITLISLLSAYVFGNFILKPLFQLKGAANAMRDGDFSARSRIVGFDEVAATAQAFDRMAENIQQYDKMKSQFFANLSHEFKTPLNVILASTQLMEKIMSAMEVNLNHHKISRQVSTVKQNCYRLIRMISNLLDISRYDGGFLNVRLANYNIVSVVEDVTQSIVRYAEAKGIEILFDTEIEEKVIACDPDMIERILLNLLSNALKFTNAGGNITVHLFDFRDRVRISVKDTGVGIPKEKLDAIFERFIQVESSLSRNHQGSGIGLSLAKALVEVHQGTISVESELGKGSEFIIEIPVVVIPEEVSLQQDVTASTQHTLVEKINIEFSDIYEIRNIG